MKEKWTVFCNRFGRYLYPFVFFFALILLDVSFRALHPGAGTTSATHWTPNVFTLCWTAILSVIVYLVPGLAKRIVMSIFVGTFVILAFVHAVLYHVSGSFLSFSDLAFAEDAAAFISIQYLTFSWKIYLFLFLSLAVGVLAILMAPKKEKIHWITLVVCVLLLSGSVTGIILTHCEYLEDGTVGKFEWTDTYNPGSISSYYMDFSNSNECLKLCGIYQHLFRSFTYSLGDFFNYGRMRDEASEYFESQAETQSNEMTGVLEGQNAIAILLESIDTWMITEEFMPNLWALQQNSLDFVHHYTPLFLSAGTFNTEFAFNIGFYLPATGTSARTYATNVYPQSLPNLFRNHGYAANSYHTLDGRFYNREVVHPQWGYEAFNDHDILELTGDQTRDTTLMEGYEKMVGHDSLFFDYIITYSGHGPYTEARSAISGPHLKKANVLAKESGIKTDNADTWNQFVRAIAHAQETDAFIGQLVEKMTEDGTIHNTTLILFGDHYSKYLTDTGFVMELKGVSDMNTICNTPFFIYSEKLESQTVEKYTSSVDMLPTVANLFGLEYDARYLVGHDAFSEEGGFVCFSDYSWIDSEMYWTPDYQGEETEKIKERNREVKALLSTSWNTVKTNYFAYQK